MNRLSTNWTIFLKLFVPTFWVIFFGALCLAVFLSDSDESSMFNSSLARYILVFCYFVFFGFLYFTLMRLIRIDFDEEFLYVTNYFKTYRYTFDSVERIHHENYGLFKLITIQFKTQSKFGKKIYCLPDKIGLNILKSKGLIHSE